ncbi:MAG: HAD-IA family hydrolase [Cytophagales bacterium]|nr:HAD-IA family hydrolase [Cytophagales bacterium]
MMKKEIKAVIFDCDGTLVDSEVLGAKAMHEIAAQYGCSMPFDAFNQSYTGRNMALNIETINSFSETPMPESFATEVRAAMAIKFAEELKEIAGATALLTHLHERGIPVAVATNGPRAKAEQTLGLTGLLSFFQNPDRLFSAYEHHTFKPDPALFLLAAASLQVAPEHCAAVEDSLSGLRAAVRAGMQTFSLVDVDSLPERLSPAPIYLAHLSELERHL